MLLAFPNPASAENSKISLSCRNGATAALETAILGTLQSVAECRTQVPERKLVFMHLKSRFSPTAARPRRLENSSNGSRLILSVDDEPTILYTREMILQREGYDVLSAANGEDALRIFAMHAVDLVLLDYLMPVMDGGIVAQKMKEHKPLVPVIMVSANHAPEEALACAECFVPKGDGPVLLLKTIRQFLPPYANQRCA